MSFFELIQGFCQKKHLKNGFSILQKKVIGAEVKFHSANLKTLAAGVVLYKNALLLDLKLNLSMLCVRFTSVPKTSNEKF